MNVLLLLEPAILYIYLSETKVLKNKLSVGLIFCDHDFSDHKST